MYADGMTVRQIGEAVSIPFSTITRYLNKAGVNLRNPGAPRIEALNDRALLQRLYVDEGLSTTQIAAHVGGTPRVVASWLEKHGIERRSTGSEKGHGRATESARRKMSEAKRGCYIGDENPNWNGGTLNRDPERNRYPAKVWAAGVKDRDNHTCQDCGSQERLHAHHIKRWKDYPALRYDLSNGITLCSTCHERAHGRGFKFRWPQYAESATSAPPLT